MSKSSLFLCLQLFIATVIFSSCSNSGIQNFSAKETYLKAMSSKNFSALQKDAKEDATYLTSLVDSLKNIAFTISFSISGGPISPLPDNGKPEIDTAKTFSLSTPDTINKQFTAYVNGLYFNQDFETENNKLNISSEVSEIDQAEIFSKILKIYSTNKLISSAEPGIQKADSALVETVCRFPTRVDTVTVYSGDIDSFTVNGNLISIDKLEGDEFEYTMPISLYSKLLQVQGVNKEGILMESKNNSAMPQTNFSSMVLAKFKSAISILNSATLKPDKEGALKSLSSIDASLFKDLQLTISLLKDLKKFDQSSKKTGSFEDAVTQIKGLEKKYASILFPEFQKGEMRFQDNLASVLLYFGTGMDSIRSQKIVLAYRNINPYNVYFDNKENKYGIADSNGKIVIKAVYEHLNSYGYPFFNAGSGDLFYLNEKTKKLELLPKEVKGALPLNDNYASIHNDEYKYGIIKGSDKIIIPMTYEAPLQTCQNLFFTTEKIRGRELPVILNANNNRISVKDMKEYILPEHKDGRAIIKTIHGMYAILGLNGEIKSALYASLKSLGNGMFSYREKGDDYLGLLDTNGNIIKRRGLKDVYPFVDGKAMFQDKEDGAWGYLDTHGNIAIPPSFDLVWDYNNGYAVVEKAGYFYTIDVMGNIIHTLGTTKEDLYDNGEGVQTVISVGAKRFNYKGEPLK